MSLQEEKDVNKTIECLDLCKYVDHNTIINVIRRSLGYIDKRLIAHGERVAYIADKIADMGVSLSINRQKLMVLCLLHDIGAYKTEEISNMVQFETNDVINHAVFGYVFLLNTTSLGDCAEAILYHHTHYEELLTADTEYKKEAELIFLADRIDIMLLQKGFVDKRELQTLSGTVFDPELVSLFLAAEDKYDVSRHIIKAEYMKEIDELIAAFEVSEERIKSYLKMLVYSIDFRSPYTVTHTANTTIISGILADLFGVSAESKELILRGAFLHDIGKIAIPYDILEKPGKLDAAQMALMRTHVSVTEEILQNLVPEDVRQIAVRHHEKLNGKGYPHGLLAENMTLEQMIVAVADVVSALINRRSYKEPFPREKTIVILKSMRDNGELCPEVCDTVIAHFEEIMDITDRSDDPVIRLYETINKQYRDLLRHGRRSHIQ